MDSDFTTHHSPQHHALQHHDDHHRDAHHGGFERGIPGGVRRRGMGPGFGGPGGHRGLGPFGGFGPGGPPRKRRGDVRAAILSLLGDGAANGYALIRKIGERSGGTWHPSPGSVYPTLQQLVDEELIEPTGDGKRTEFALTDAGREYTTEHAEELTRVWDGSAERAEADAGLKESIGALMGVVQQFRFAATDDQRGKAVAKLDETRSALYGILAE